MQKVVQSNGFQRLRSKLVDQVLSSQELTQLKGGNGNTNPIPPPQQITEDLMDL